MSSNTTKNTDISKWRRQKNENLLFGGVCATPKEIFFKVYGRVPWVHRNSSLQEEAFGGLIIAIITNCYLEYNKFKQPAKVEYFVDNMAVIKRLPQMSWHKTHPSKMTKPEFKALEKMHNEHQKLSLVNARHVKGHQTENSLTWSAQLNNRCDILANKVWYLEPVEYCRLPHTEATVAINDLPADSAIPMTLQQAFTTQQLQHYMQNKYKWNNAVDYINGTVHIRALNSLSYNQRKTITKFIHEWLPVNSHPGSQPNNTNTQSAKNMTKCNTTYSLVNTNQAKLSMQRPINKW